MDVCNCVPHANNFSGILWHWKLNWSLLVFWSSWWRPATGTACLHWPTCTPSRLYTNQKLVLGMSLGCGTALWDGPAWCIRPAKSAVSSMDRVSSQMLIPAWIQALPSHDANHNPPLCMLLRYMLVVVAWPLPYQFVSTAFFKAFKHVITSNFSSFKTCISNKVPFKFERM